MKRVIIYTDGACSGNPGMGGWAAIINQNGAETEISGFDKYTTNNRMELKAAIEALKLIHEPSEIELYSDSSYFIDGFQKRWVEKWKANNWYKADGTEAKNVDLWKELDEFNKVHQINWIKVKGHSDNEFNIRCDKLATAEIKKNTAETNAAEKSIGENDTTEKNIGEKDAAEKSAAETNAAEMYHGENRYSDNSTKYEEKTKSRKHIYKGNIIAVEMATVELPDGREATRDIVLHPGAAVIIPVDKSGNIYMVRQYRKPIERTTLELPAGKLDQGEAPELCAKRELREETGLSASDIRHLISIHTTPGFCNEVIHVYLATGLYEGESNADDDEFISTEKVPAGRLIEMVLNHEITDAKSIIGILLAEKYLRGEI